ncbi:PTS ascorbate transporter subunit IIC [Geosporobacter ferrireducens]|uniref:Ascorbate-specific PTS system EIIC component n=1 Tax=Geosporobacter ferrireducens TaxID=1424294 RepID=A0A1D8GMD7_9FIRM|nr:PTS ascorbate transporter subunit IIC [Geosporobacter ferrireducens]AOT72099.1 PTS ascorbate transporter subunit IIC [Geosporobacter ferrireducens]MTI55986.1 PTS ascorbate transporter subunit IIC [Geosporobacter ferrireducens]
MNFLDGISRGVLGEPAFVLGIIACIGLIVQKEAMERVIQGTIKTILGYILIQIGASAAGVALGNLSLLIQRGFQVIGIIPHNEIIVALAQINYGNYIAWIMLFGMVIHLLIARWSPLKYVFLTGHHMLFMASMLAAVLAVSSLSKWKVILLGAVLLAMAMSVGPAVIQPFVRKITNNNTIAVGHFNSIGFVIAGLIASCFKSEHKEEKETPLPGFRRFQVLFQDHILSTTLFMFILFLLAGFFVGRETMEELFFSRPPIVIAVMQAVWFAAGAYVILMGVRMLLSEIVPAFQGISEKIVPNGIPALDCPILFPYAPIASIFGFLFSLMGGVAAMLLFIMRSNQYTIIIPGIVTHFFSGGAAGVIAYRIGRKRGLVTACFVHGFVITFLPYFLVPILSGLGYVRATFGDSDFAIMGFFTKWILNFFLTL